MTNCLISGYELIDLTVFAVIYRLLKCTISLYLVKLILFQKSSSSFVIFVLMYFFQAVLLPVLRVRVVCVMFTK